MSAVEAQRPSTPTTDSHMEAYPRSLASAQPQFFYPAVSQARGGSMYGYPFDGYSPYYYPAHDSYRAYDARAYGMPFLERKMHADEKLLRSPKEENSEAPQNADEGHKKTEMSPPPTPQPSSPHHEDSQRQSPAARRSLSPERTSPRRDESSEFSAPEERRTPERQTFEERREFKQEQPYDFSRSRDEKTGQSSPPIAERFRSASFSYTPQRYHLQSERSSDNSMSPPRYLPHYKEDDKWNQQSHPDPLTSLLQKYSGHPDMASLPSLQFPGMSKSKEMHRMPGHIPITPPKYPVSLNNISPGHTSMSPRQPDSYPSPATPTRSRSLDLENMAPNKGDYYYCHLCSYVGNSKFHFNAHMNSHFEHGCPHCDYTSRTEGRLKRHIKDFHSEEPPDSFAGNKTPNKQEPEGPPNRPKIFKCRQCEFASENKIEFWEHSRVHIKEDKVLQCPKCPFVTEYKHHLEYHLRNHFGSKPFKCGKCNYACVNKSMLNSHMKSHTNVYQYRCSDCTYATKYCHSLKLHLKKYNHKPATVLNPDGSLPTDGSGDFELVSKRGPPRGPRGTKRERSPSATFPSPSIMMPSQANIAAAAVAAAAAATAAAAAVHSPMTASPALMPPHPSCWPPGLMTSTPNSTHGPPPLIPASSVATPALNPLSIQVRMQEAREPQNLCTKPQQEEGSLNLTMASPSTKESFPDTDQFKCKVCEFQADSRQMLLQHVLRIHAAENQDLFSVFGMHAENMLTEEISSDATKEALRKSIERDDMEQSPANKKHFNKVLAEDMLANIEAESTKKEDSNQEEEEEEGDMTPKRRMSTEDAEESTSPGDGPSPRKRSRKGKAYKLDMISIRLQERYTGSPAPEGSEGHQDDDEASDYTSDDNKIKSNENEDEKKAESQDENVFKVNGVNSEKVMHVIRCLEAEYSNDKPKWSGVNSPRSNCSPRPLEELKNLNAPNINGGSEYECTHCNIAFGDCIMYTMHMGYHGFSDPFKCNMCGHVAKDKVGFFLHIARAPHE